MTWLKSAVLSRLHPLYPQLFGHWRRVLTSSKYRQIEKEKAYLRRLPRFTRGHAFLSGFNLEFADSASFLYMWEEIFNREIYHFSSDVKTPFFIDAGANIGLATLYLKTRFPNAHIIAFEPDAAIVQVLKTNIQRASIKGVEIIPHALWSTETTLRFRSDGADGGRLEEDISLQHSVTTVRLRSYMQSKVDFLKMDIEGAEIEVLQDCADLLVNVERIFVEFHSFENRVQGLAQLCGLLENAGFRLHLAPSLVSMRPLESRTIVSGMDSQINIFGFRV
ncbi:MAG TPA: FkbM family methyltransferase [Abditibacterium sp.]|jgi:FkbM family methyltransferase